MISHRFWLVLTLVMLAGFYKATATHLRAGEITVKRTDCTSLTFEITVTVYIDTTSPVQFGGSQGDEVDILDFGDGKKFIIPAQTTIARPDLGPNIGIASYTKTHTYGGPGRYVISYIEPNRNPNVLNMVNSVYTTFYIETEINIDPYLGCNSTPILLIPPVDQGCTGVAFQHNPGAYDPNPKDSLSYVLVVPFRDRATEVAGYDSPIDPAFYGNTFSTGNENQNGAPTFAINPVTGTITWDAPGFQGIGEYNIAFHIIEWRKIDGEWIKIGYVRRDMQIVIKECDNERPDLIIPEDLCVVAGTSISEIITGIDVDNNNVKIEAFSEIFDPNFVSPATFTAPSFKPQPANSTFTWNTVCEHVRERPYQIVFKVTDNGQPNLVTFKTWFITVIGPPPEWNQATVDLAKRHVLLEWDQYTSTCDNASKVQIWRRVDSFNYVPTECETGMPEFLGYQLIREVDATATSFLDTNNGNGLSVGARYCYRLVATFPLTAGGESILSDEICIDPIKADAPVITEVSVLETDEVNGKIKISWLAPFDIDPVQFPPPYKYKVWRSESFTGALPWVSVHSGEIDVLTVEDNSINTTDVVYSYNVVLYSATQNNAALQPVDTSSTASMVRLDVRSLESQLDLSWTAFTPWSNIAQDYPLHDVYRGPEGITDGSSFSLIQQVDVTTEGFVYSDVGTPTVPLSDDEVYCYRVMTRGTYGNPAIAEPLNNYSQIVCAQPSDFEPPTCVPEPLVVNINTCEAFDEESGLCGVNSFMNEIRWNRVLATECDGEILGYKVYVGNSSTGEFNVVQFGDKDYTRDTVFVDENLSSFARCYRISVVDRSGNESELSAPVCNDNCPFYALPNVFTPNGDGCNDLFRAYGDPFDGASGEETGGTPASCKKDANDYSLCARYVEQVVFKVYNRWGNLVYEFESIEGDVQDKSIYIRWNGRDTKGDLLNAGVYYYSAEVRFTTIDPDKRNQTLKGWVHLIR